MVIEQAKTVKINIKIIHECHADTRVHTPGPDRDVELGEPGEGWPTNYANNNKRNEKQTNILFAV